MTKPNPSDFGPSERFKQGDLIVIEETIHAGIMRARNYTSDALEAYYRRKQLCPSDKTDNQRRYDAGARLRGHWERAGLQPRVTTQYSDWMGEGSVNGFRIGCLDAYKKFREAVEMVGIIASNEVIEVCCFGDSVGEHRIIILRRGLESLARGYGY